LLISGCSIAAISLLESLFKLLVKDNGSFLFLA